MPARLPGLLLLRHGTGDDDAAAAATAAPTFYYLFTPMCTARPLTLTFTVIDDQNSNLKAFSVTLADNSRGTGKVR